MMNIIKTIIKKRNLVKYWRSLGAKIGNDWEIYNTANFCSEPYLVSIGNRVRINPGVQFVTYDGGAWVLRNIKDGYKNIDLIKPIQVGNNCHIGTNAVIMPGVKIGNNVIVGVGSIVTRDVPDNSVVVGVPARVIENIDDYCEKHKDEFIETKGMTSKQKKSICCIILRSLSLHCSI